jgi:hypothetical protein
MENKRQRIELADIFDSHAETFLKGHPLCPVQQKAFDAVMKCRTSALGGHADSCDQCGYTRQSYNSCRNRHCPRCQFVKMAQWTDRLAANLPPVKHFHVVFTIPECLHPLFYSNQHVAYGLLFKAAGQALAQCSAKYLGVQSGAVAILHTWGQTLTYHPHIHMIVPAGGLSEDEMEWVHSGNRFYLPVRALSAVFRGLLCGLIEKEVAQGGMKLLGAEVDFKATLDLCHLKKWVVYCEKPFSSPDSLVRYLGNYTHRVAISSHRLLEHADGKVTFSYKDYKSAGIQREMTLEAHEFIRRFLQHILPDGFSKIRYFGFMALCNMQTKLALCFDLIDKATYLPVLLGLNALEVWRAITGKDPLCCPRCQAGKMRPVTQLIAIEMKPG